MSTGLRVLCYFSSQSRDSHWKVPLSPWYDLHTWHVNHLLRVPLVPWQQGWPVAEGPPPAVCCYLLVMPLSCSILCC